MKTFNGIILSSILILLVGCGSSDNNKTKEVLNNKETNLTFGDKTTEEYLKNFEFTPYCTDETPKGYHGRQDTSVENLVFYTENGERFALLSEILFLDNKFKLKITLGENVSYIQHGIRYGKAHEEITIEGFVIVDNSTGLTQLSARNRTIGTLEYGGKYNDKDTLLLSLEAELLGFVPSSFHTVYKNAMEDKLQMTAHKYVYSDNDDAELFCNGAAEDIFVTL